MPPVRARHDPPGGRVSRSPARRPVTSPGRGAGGRVGILGGTFDPVHHGHLAAASEVADLLCLDEVVFVPAGAPWQKADTTVSSTEDRYRMVVIATASHPLFSVSRVDLDRDGPTYTIDTLRDLQAGYGDGTDLFFVTGADTLQGVPSWREPEALLRLAHFVGVNRPGHPLSDAHLPAGTVTLLDVPALDISSRDCRERVLTGRPIRYLVPDGVLSYIEEHGLYRGDRVPGGHPGRVGGFGPDGGRGL